MRKIKNSKKAKWSTKSKVIAIVSAIAGIVLILALSSYMYMQSLLNKINYVSDSGASSVSEITTDNSGNSLVSSKSVYNILLIGSDSRSNSTASSRSDSMILISINSNTKKIIMTSFMRDSYVSIPGHGKNRLNAAFAYGGSSLLLTTIEKNFSIKIDKYVIVDFFSFIDIVDKLGGVNIDVSSAELPVLNNYVKEINRLKGLSTNDGLLKQSGKNLLLTGKQALGYSRIRYVGNADFERTERQRTVLNKIIAKLKKQNVVGLTSILNTLLPDVTTNLSKNDITSLLFNAMTYSKYSIEQDRIPIDGSYKGKMINGNDVLTIDIAKNVAELKSKIYGQ